jgi:hypothetical protein
LNPKSFKEENGEIYALPINPPLINNELPAQE